MRGLIHTCEIQRDTQAATDPYGHKREPTWVALDTVRCRLVPQLSNVRGMGGLVGKGDDFGWRDVVKSVFRILLPAGTDFTELDRIVDVKDRLGVVIEPGPLSPLLVRVVSGSVEHHRSAILERIE